MLQDELLQAYDEIKDGIEKAEDSTVPFPVVKDEKISVIGDANETQINMHDFKIKFKLPAGVDGDKPIVKDAEYKNVFITPRRSAKVTASLCKLYPYFKKVGEGGDISDYSDDEVVALLAEWDDEMIDTMYNLVASVLNVDERLVDFMLPSSVISATVQIIRGYPEAVNESDVFFG